MLPTDHFIRFEHVTSAEQTERGLLAAVHTERLRIDLVRDDVVRIKMSRGGVFDEAPTHAVCVDPLAEPADFRFERDDECVRSGRPTWWSRCGSTRSALTSTAPTGPRRRGSSRPEGRYWTYATLNDSFTIRRRCGGADRIFGLGEKSGRHDRKGRDFTLWNNDVLSEVGSLEFTSGKEPGDPVATARARSSTRTT